MIINARDIRVNDCLIISKVTSINPYLVQETRVVIHKVETSKGRVRAYHGLTSQTYHPTQTVVIGE